MTEKQDWSKPHRPIGLWTQRNTSEMKWLGKSTSTRTQTQEPENTERQNTATAEGINLKMNSKNVPTTEIQILSHKRWLSRCGFREITFGSQKTKDMNQSLIYASMSDQCRVHVYLHSQNTCCISDLVNKTKSLLPLNESWKWININVCIIIKLSHEPLIPFRATLIQYGHHRQLIIENTKKKSIIQLILQTPS